MLARSPSNGSLISSAKEDGAARSPTLTASGAKSPTLGSTRSLGGPGSSMRLSSRRIGDSSRDEGGLSPDARVGTPSVSVPRSLRPPVVFTMDKDGNFHAAPTRPPLVLSSSSSILEKMATSSKRSIDSQPSTPSESTRNLNLYSGVSAENNIISRSNRSGSLQTASRRSLQGTPRSGTAASRTRARVLTRWRFAVTFLRAAWRFAAPVRRAAAEADERRTRILATRAGPQRSTADDVSLRWPSPVACLHVPKTHSPSAITSWLFIGDRADAADVDKLLRLGITHVLNVATNCPAPPHALQFVYEHLPIFDTDTQKIADVLPRAVAFIRDAHVSGGRILVHCIMGVSRSVTLAAAYLISASGPRLPLSTALAMLIKQRPIAMPNSGFRLQLALYEFTEQGTSSVADLDHADAVWDFAAWRVNTIRTGLLAERTQKKTFSARLSTIAVECRRLWSVFVTRSAAVAPTT